jgi:hypothetical protein
MKSGQWSGSSPLTSLSPENLPSGGPDLNDDLARPLVTRQGLEAAYREMAADEDREREAEAWGEGVIGDVADEPR